MLENKQLAYHIIEHHHNHLCYQFYPHAWIVQKRDKNKDNSLFNNQRDESATEKSKHLY